MALPYWVTGRQANSAGRPSRFRQMGVKRLSRTAERKFSTSRHSAVRSLRAQRRLSVSPPARKASSRAMRGETPK